MIISFFVLSANHEAEHMPTKKDVENKREAAMQELASAGVSPSRKLKNQTTNDRSAPQVSGLILIFFTIFLNKL